MAPPNARDDLQLVRCLDCGTVYSLPFDLKEADACPECGGVGWVALAALERDENRSSS